MTDHGAEEPEFAEPAELAVSGKPAASATRASGPGYPAAKRATWFVVLALANIIGAALLFFAVAKGQDAASSYRVGCPSTMVPYYTPQMNPGAYPSGYSSYSPSGSSGSVTYSQVALSSCGKPFARPFWGLGAAPVVAVIVSGFLMSVLYDSRQRRLAVLQTGFFVLTLGYAVFGGSALVSYWF